MNLNNLLFFDRNGESYNLEQDVNGVWTGNDYFSPISVALYDVSNIFILEKVGSDYKFPVLEEGSRIEIKWISKQAANQLFLFTVGREDSSPESPTYIARQDAITINRSDFSGSGDLDLAYPLQVNVGFSPTEERIYQRILVINYVTSTTTTTLASIAFYGEGEDEDERFRVWLSNFGIKFNREDALILKDYDLKEGLPDWKQINSARKQVLVNRDQVYPYVGTYKGMTNLINLLGYRDVIRVKEYWRDNDPNSGYYNKFAMVDITDLMNIGSVDDVNLVDLNGQIKKTGKFKKTEFLAIVYEFSKATDTFDDDGLPEVEYTTEFSVDEIFYKLNRLADKLKVEILPVNVKIRDIIGEFIYFEKLTVRVWMDATQIDDLEVNDTYTLKITSPITKSHQLRLIDVKPLYPKTVLPDLSLSSFPEITYNDGTVEPYSNGQKYTVSLANSLVESIEKYYSQLIDYEFTYHGQVNPLMSEDDTTQMVGCPICIEAYLPDIMLGEFGGSKFGDYAGTSSTSGAYYTIGSVRYKGGYEIEWNISGPQGYKFNWRAPVPELITLPHILPHSGDYVVTATVHNLQGAASNSSISINVEASEPSIEVFTKLQDKTNYQFRNLRNVKVGDMMYSTLGKPSANVLQNGESASTLPKHYIDFNTYLNRFGIGSPFSDAEIYSEVNGWEKIGDSDNDIAVLWGTGSIKGQATLTDYGFASLNELVYNRLVDFSYSSDRLNGFYINLVDNPEQIIAINLVDGTSLTDEPIDSYSTAQDLADLLNASTNIHISEYRYSVINGNIHAQALRQDRMLNRIIYTLDSAGIRRRIYTFCEPVLNYSNGLFDQINSQLATVKLEMDRDLAFLDVPFQDLLRKIGETCYSTTSVTVPAVVGGSITFDLSKPTEFSLPAPASSIKIVSISDPTTWIKAISFTQPDNMTLDVTVYDFSGAGNTASDWEFYYEAIVPDYPAGFANASDMSYWVNRGCIEYDTSGANPSEYLINGYLPSNYDENTFTLSNLKIGLGALTVPLFHPVFAVVSNVNSKKGVVWTLKNYETEVVRMRTSSYFVWRFDSPGEYLLTAEVTDAFGNSYTMSRSFNASSALSIEDYKKHVEVTLDKRKGKSIASPLEY